MVAHNKQSNVLFSQFFVKPELRLCSKLGTESGPRRGNSANGKRIGREVASVMGKGRPAAI